MADRHRRKDSWTDLFADPFLRPEVRPFTLFAVVMVLVSFAVWKWTPGFVPEKRLTIVRLGVLALAAVLGALLLARRRR